MQKMSALIKSKGNKSFKPSGETRVVNGYGKTREKSTLTRNEGLKRINPPGWQKTCSIPLRTPRALYVHYFTERIGIYQEISI